MLGSGGEHYGGNRGNGGNVGAIHGNGGGFGAFGSPGGPMYVDPAQRPLARPAPPPVRITPQGPVMTQAPGQYLSSGLPGYGVYRPGYNFMGPGSAGGGQPQMPQAAGGVGAGIGAGMFDPMAIYRAMLAQRFGR